MLKLDPYANTVPIVRIVYLAEACCFMQGLPVYVLVLPT